MLRDAALSDEASDTEDVPPWRELVDELCGRLAVCATALVNDASPQSCRTWMPRRAG